MPKEHAITVRMSDDMVNRIFRVLDKYPKVFPDRIGRKFNRQVVLEIILERGLDDVESDIKAKEGES